MKSLFMKIWKAEPVIVTVLTNAAFWPAAFTAASAFGHPIPDGQQHALIGLSALISGAIVRQTVTSPQTADKTQKDIAHVN